MGGESKSPCNFFLKKRLRLECLFLFRLETRGDSVFRQERLFWRFGLFQVEKDRNDPKQSSQLCRLDNRTKHNQTKSRKTGQGLCPKPEREKFERTKKESFVFFVDAPREGLHKKTESFLFSFKVFLGRVRLATGFSCLLSKKCRGYDLCAPRTKFLPQ